MASHWLFDSTSLWDLVGQIPLLILFGTLPAPHAETALQSSVSDGANDPKAQAAHEPAVVALAPVSLLVPSVCFPQLVCAAQLFVPKVA
jgi:hypothetical protein